MDGRPSTSKHDPNPEVNNQNKERRRWRKNSQSKEKRMFRSDQIEDANTTTNSADAFLIFFDAEVVDRLVFETNLYCTKKGKVGNILKDEMYVFFGINVMMGYHRLPSLRHYWMNGDYISVCAIRRAMTRDRFQYILGNLHVNDNAKLDRRDKIYKVRPLVEALNERFRDKRAPSQHLSVDESMIRFKGRSYLK